jgi:ssDNA-binding Zn-finger/Zn-ribbon topoisomerase 1
MATIKEVQWTAAKKKRYLAHKGVRCPDCNSTNITAERIDADGGTAMGYVTCLECKVTWQDVYKLTDVT